MSDLIRQIVTGVVESVVKELLGKSHGRTPSKRKKRQARSSTSGRFTSKAAKPRAAKPARKQVSRKRTAASRSKQRAR